MLTSMSVVFSAFIVSAVIPFQTIKKWLTSPRKPSQAPRPDSFLEKFTYTDTAEGTVEGILLNNSNGDSSPTLNRRLVPKSISLIPESPRLVSFRDSVMSVVPTMPELQNRTRPTGDQGISLIIIKSDSVSADLRRWDTTKNRKVLTML